MPSLPTQTAGAPRRAAIHEPLGVHEDPDGEPCPDPSVGPIYAHRHCRRTRRRASRGGLVARAVVCLLTAWPAAPFAQDALPSLAPAVWINEIHHSNAGPDTGEGVELAGPAGTLLDGWHLHVYSGYGSPYSVHGPDAQAASTVPLHGAIDDEAGGLGAVWVALAGLRSGCNGVALTDPSGALAQFLSTGGCRFNALEGPVYDRAVADGAGDPSHVDALVWSTAIQGPGGRRVQEWNAMPAGYSLQLTGAGLSYGAFHWGGPYPATPGQLNDYQAPLAGGAAGSSPSRTAGAPFAEPLAVPAHDVGHDEDDAAQPPGLPAAPELAVGLPSPNPAAHVVHLDVALPGDAVSHVLDARGRRVRSLPLPHGTTRATLDVSTLAPGAYAVRVVVTPHGEDRPVLSATRRFTITR